MRKLLFKSVVQHRKSLRRFFQNTQDFRGGKPGILKLHVAGEQFGGGIQIIGEKTARQFDFPRIFAEIVQNPQPGILQGPGVF